MNTSPQFRGDLLLLIAVILENEILLYDSFDRTTTCAMSPVALSYTSSLSPSQSMGRKNYNASLMHI
jgi:hypothetical protein